MYRLLFTPVLLVAVASASLAQKAPKRPQLPEGADTNDARAYLEFGHALVKRNEPRVAADSYYWSARLDPSLADAYYGQYAAIHMSDGRRLSGYWNGYSSALKHKDVKRADSLFAYGLMLNPVVILRHERALVLSVIRADINSYGGVPLGPADEPYLERYLDQILKEWSTAGRARMTYADGNYEHALHLYGQAIKSARRKSGLRAARGRLFLQLGRADSAVYEFNLALEELRKAEKKDVVYMYNSKAHMELASGIAHEQLGDTSAARKAYGRALEEDLAFFPAHVRLGYLATSAGDTATGVSELALAVELQPKDGLLRQQYGVVLASAGRHQEAVTELMKSIEFEPFFALPHRLLGDSYEKLGKPGEAMAAYKSFLSLASANAPLRAEIAAKVSSSATR